MSKEIDQKVVEMRFDNQEFARNVDSTITSLEKLKSSLQFKDGEKGFKNIDKAAKDVDMTHLGKGLDTVKDKFSAMGIVGVTALVNITNSAMAAGKKIISALTIDPVKTGFKEYETQINAVQTIMANVGHKGKTLEDVNKALDELNEYADQTIYNFTEMTKNIGLFTNAGIDLDKSVSSIKGFSNAAAMAGADSTNTARAMYQLSQAMSSGRVQLMDWRSLEQANITGERFQDTIKITARAHGIAIDDMIKAEGSLRDTLKSGWLTADLMAEALDHYTLSTEHMTEEEQKANRERLLSIGYTEEQIDGLFKLGTEATNAATKVKTFTQLWDVLKEAAQSGWAKTWRIIIGDFEEAKALFTPLANFLTGIIDKSAKARNALLESALGKRFVELSESLKKVVDPAKGVVDSIGGVVNTLKDYDTIVDEIIAGKWKNAPTRWQDLEAAGYDWAHAQNLVNERLGCAKRHATDYTEAQQEATTATVEMTEATAKELEELTRLSEAELKALGYTDEQISAIKQLKKEADKLGLSVGDFLLQMDGLTGRQILLNSFKNIGQGLVKTFGAIGKAYRDIFPPMTGDQLYNIIAAFHKFSLSCKMSDDTAEKLRRTFKGLFAIIDIIFTVVGGPIKLAFKALCQILGMANLNILDVTASIGDAIVKFRDFIDDVLDFTKVFEKIIPTIKEAAKAIGDWVKSLKESDNIPRDIVMGLVNGLKSAFTWVGEALCELGKYIIETFCKILGIHSPSTVFFGFGVNIVEGLINGIKYLVTAAIDIVKNLGIEIIEALRNLTIGDVITMALTAGVIVGVKKFYEVVRMFAAPFVGLGRMFAGIGDFMEELGDSVKKLSRGANKYLKAKAWEAKSRAILNLAIALGILSASVYVLSKMSWGDLAKAGVALLGLSVILVILSNVAKKVGKEGGSIGKLGLVLIAMGIAIRMMASAMASLTALNWNNLGPAAIGMAMIGTILLLFTAIAKKHKKKDVAGVASMLLALAVAFYIMASVVKSMGELEMGALIQGGLVILAFAGVIAGLMLLTKFCKGVGKLGAMFAGVAAALLSMSLCVLMLGGMEEGRLKKGLLCVIGFGAVIAGFMLMTKFMGNGTVKGLGILFLGIAAVLLSMALCVRMLGGMEVGQILKGLVCVVAFGAVIGALMLVAKAAGGGKRMLGVAATLLAIGVVLAIMAALVVVLGLIPSDIIQQGLTVVIAISAMLALVLLAAKQAERTYKPLLALALVFGVLAASIIILSFISPEQLVGPTIVMTALMGMMALVLSMCNRAKKAQKTLYALTAVIVALAGAVALLSSLPADKALISAGILGVLIGEMALIIKILGVVNAGSAAKSAAALLILVVALYGIVGVLHYMTGIENAVGKAAALGVVFGIMSGVIAILSKLNVGLGAAIKGAIALTALCIPLLALVGIFAVLQFVDVAMEKVMALGLLLLMMSIALIPLTLIGAAIVPALLGVVALTALCVPLLAVIGLLYLMEGLEKATENVHLLTNIIDSFVPLMIVLALCGPMALIGITALYALVGFITVIGVLATALGALVEHFPSLKTFLSTGIDMLVMLAEGIGRIMVAFMGVVVDFIVTTLPSLGLALGQFMTNAMAFVVGMKMVDGAVLEGVLIMTGAILALTASSLIDGIASFFGCDFEGLGTKLRNFMTNSGDFFEKAKNIDEGAMRGIKCLAEAVMVLTASDFLSGIADFLGFGGDPIGDFAAMLPGLGAGIGSLCSSISNLSDDDLSRTELAARIIKTLAEAADAIPNSGGLAGFFAGENDLGVFAEQIAEAGTSLKTFLENVGEFGDPELAIVKAGTQAITEFAKASQEISNSGGVAGFFAGENDLETFTKEIEAAGTSLKNFITNIGTFGEEQLAVVKSGAQAVTEFAKASREIENEGGIASWFTGDSDMETFGEEIEAIGASLANFVTNAGDLTGDAGEVIARGISLFKEFTKLAKIVNDDEYDPEGLEDFAEEIVDALDAFASVKVSDNDSLTRLASLSTTIPTIGKNLNKFLAEAKKFGDNPKSKVQSACAMIETFSKSAKNVASSDNVSRFTTLCDAITKAKNELAALSKALVNFTSESSMAKLATSFKNVGSVIATSLSTGVKDKTKTVTDTIQKVLDSMGDKIESDQTKSDFKLSGKFVVQGFADGIKLYTYISDKAAKDMAKSAKDSANGELNVNSPSKVFMETGKSVVEGFAKGITKNIKLGDKAAVDLGFGALTAIQKALGIHSPSLVFKEDVGRWIAEGIAEGINKDMSAEEAAEKKAQNISSAFQKGLQDIDYKINISTNEYEGWKLVEGANANDALKFAKNERYLAEQYKLLNEKAKMALDRLTQTRELFDQGKLLYTAVLAAHADYTAAQREANAALVEHQKFSDSKVTEELNKVVKDSEQAIKNRDKLHELWLKEDGKNATEEEKNTKAYDTSKANLQSLEKMLKNAQAHHDYLISINASQEDIQKAWDQCRDFESRIADTRAKIADIRAKYAQIELDELETQISFRDQQYEILKAELGSDISEKELSDLEISHLTDELVDLSRKSDVLFGEWSRLKTAYEKGEATLEEVEQAKSGYYDATLAVLNAKNEISDLQEEAAEREQEALEKRYELADKTADLTYKLWEATEGKDATGAEKDIKKLGMLQTQLMSQTGLLIEAEKEWRDAADEFGDSSNEAQEAYNNYLQKQVDIATLQSDIADLQEKAVTREKAAAAEYKDYIKKYAKYYEENGMTESDLKKDAKLVSGYDGNSTVNKMLSSSKDAFNNIESNPLYTQTIDGYTKLGTSYMDAVSAGFDAGAEALASACIDMMNDCLLKLESVKESWFTVGKNCVLGFVNGIETNSWMAVKAAETMARDAMTAAKEVFDEHSPSREFMKIGEYAAQGLAIGLTENSYLSSNAATSLGEETINSLRDTIKLVNDVVTSEIDSQPTIRPVLDISDVKSKAAKLNTMFSNSLALEVGSNMSKSHTSDSSQNGTSNTASGNTYQFTQNNYSPKALSRAEIYRQTKNQFAAMKGALK